jgi:hypothetical protein
MSDDVKKIEQLIKSLKEARDILSKDDIDEKIKAKLKAEMDKRKFGEADAIRHVIDRDKGAKMPKPPKQPKPLLQSEDGKELALQKAKTEAVRNLLKKNDTPPKTDKSVEGLADQLLKSLESLSGVKKSDVPQRRPVNGQTGWSQDPSSGAFHHKIHGVISVFKDPSGKHSVKHSGKTLGVFDTVEQAGAKVKDHMDWLGSFKGGAGVARMAPTVKEEGSMDGDSDPVYKSATPAEKAEQKVMDMLAKTIGGMIAPMNRKLQPTQEEFEQAMIAQGIAFTPEQLEKMDQDWGNTMTDFFAEASKPISARFKSEEEEEAYWANIRVSDKADNGPGY